MLKLHLAAAFSFSALVASSALAQTSPTLALMKGVVQPTSRLVFEVQSETRPELVDAVPSGYSRWAEAAVAAQRLKAAAIELAGSVPMGRSAAVWSVSATAMAHHADGLIAAASAKNAERFSDAANGLLDACTACHQQQPRRE